MSYCLILNPAAGRGEASHKKDAIVAALKKNTPNMEVRITSEPDEARRIAREVRDRYEVIIAAGGDGTVHEVVNGIAGSNAVLGVIPIGSGNDFVKMLSLPKKIDEAVRVIQADRRRKIDLGKVNDEWFSNGLGIGFDADVVVEANKIKRLRGFLIYLVAVLRTLLKFNNRSVRIEVDNTVIEKPVFMISVGNGSCQGGGFYLTPDAVIDDGLLDFCVFDALNTGQILRNLIKVFFGTHTRMPQVNVIQTEKMNIKAVEGIPIHADGELLDLNARELNIAVVPEALTVIHNLDKTLS